MSNMHSSYEGPEHLRPHFNAMIENLGDTLHSIESVKGKTYHDIVVSLFAIHMQLAQIEGHACDIAHTLESLAQEADAKEWVSTKHATIHELVEATAKANAGAAHFLEKAFPPLFGDLTKNIESLVRRAESDFLSKLNHPHS